MGQMHYEGDEFPEDIPITPWREYSIPENKPDAIYIHNPYDECNLVTSVHPEKMKQIYINEYLKAARAAGLTGSHIDKKYLGRKILGLGSPKIDKVLNTKKKELDITEEWLKVIRRPDGSWKKII